MKKHIHPYFRQHLIIYTNGSTTLSKLPFMSSTLCISLLSQRSSTLSSFIQNTLTLLQRDTSFLSLDSQHSPFLRLSYSSARNTPFLTTSLLFVLDQDTFSHFFWHNKKALSQLSLHDTQETSLSKYKLRYSSS